MGAELRFATSWEATRTSSLLDNDHTIIFGTFYLSFLAACVVDSC